MLLRVKITEANATHSYQTAGIFYVAVLLNWSTEQPKLNETTSRLNGIEQRFLNNEKQVKQVAGYKMQSADNYYQMAKPDEFLSTIIFYNLYTVLSLNKK